MLPTRSNSRCCKTRSSLACSGGGSSPISSRKTVPPSATSSLPFLVAIAPVKAPFSCPNNSLSSSASGMAAQLMATNGLPARGAVVMDGARYQFLAGTAFPANKNGGIAAGHPGDELLHLPHGITFAHDDAVQIQFRLQPAIFAAQALQGENVLQSDGGDSGDRAEKVYVVFFKSSFPRRAQSGTELLSCFPLPSAARRERSPRCAIERRAC